MDSSACTVLPKEPELSAGGVETAPPPDFETGSENTSSLDKKLYNTNSTKRQLKKRDLPLSKLKERAGLKIKTQYALVRCICGRKLLAKREQQTKLCFFCGRRVWLADRRVFFKSNNYELIRKLAQMRLDNGQCVNYYRTSFLPASKMMLSYKKNSGRTKQKSVMHESVKFGAPPPSNVRSE